MIFLVGLAIIGGTIVGAYSLGLIDGALGTDVPQVAYEFEYDAEQGVLTIGQTAGQRFGGEELKTLQIQVADGTRTETFSWAAAVGPEATVAAGSSIRLDDSTGANMGSFTHSGVFNAGDTVRVVFEGRTESYTLATYRITEGPSAVASWRAPTTGLLNRYPLDEAEVVTTDMAGDGAGRNTGATRGVDGQVGSAYMFDGDDYIALDRSFDGSGTLEEVTACAWFRTSERGTGEFDNWALLDFDRSEYFNLYVRGDTGGIGFSTSGPERTMVDHSTAGDYTDGDWHLACGIYDAATDTKRIYVDGSLEEEVAAQNSGGLGTGATRYGIIGDGSEAASFDGDRNTRYFDGRIDEVRLYETVLTPSEISAIYNAGRGVDGASDPTRGLTNYWPLDEPGTTDAVADIAGGGSGTIVGTSTQRAVDGPVGNAYRFRDGSGYVALNRTFISDTVGNLTACAWFQTSEADGSENWALLDFDRSEYFNLYVEGDGDVGWSTSAVPGYDSGSVDDLYADGGFNDGDWHHACGVYDGGKRLIVDGRDRASRADPHDGQSLGTGTTRYGVIGEGSEADDYGRLTSASNGNQRNEYYYDGAVDDVRLYGRGLSTAEASRLWAFTGGAVKTTYETASRSFAEPTDVEGLSVRSLGAQLPAGTTVTVRVRADTGGDGIDSEDPLSEPVTFTPTASGMQAVDGLSGEATTVRLEVTFGGTTAAAGSPTVDGFDVLGS
ncbi:LamG domain-containing protein [Salinirubellus salinus]|uniref:LamG domain-containing protein n=1 Tax=Salinirubellus salinus TaxID=1364945 RepID=A0A9E7QZF8_9EURY|nr:LamG domain-containing protein [Salinirubellus salinus]UWM52777.1 LamG domain-containing protein [Salinirubellus salinus]